MATKTSISVWLSARDSCRTTDEPDIVVTAVREFHEQHPEYLVEIKASDHCRMPGIVARAAEQRGPPHIAEFTSLRRGP
ncbi:hypothetical protein [Micromonospora sp. RP3T]|uniref:hypothetical protein n=1 Tax=Micromonospora sp. RP3T TaxID=2135446 RepID=UPI0011B220FB|nr:hypothetical protein [Micromonospora sp. RP3T]